MTIDSGLHPTHFLSNKFWRIHTNESTYKNNFADNLQSMTNSMNVKEKYIFRMSNEKAQTTRTGLLILWIYEISHHINMLHPRLLLF